MSFIIIKVLIQIFVWVFIISFVGTWITHIAVSTLSYNTYGFSTYDKFFKEYLNHEFYVNRWGDIKSTSTSTKLEYTEIVFQRRYMVIKNPYHYAKYLLFIYNLKKDWKKSNRIDW